MTSVGQTIRYSAVSGVCLLLGMTLIPLFSAAGLHYALATVAAFCLIAVIGFYLHCHWTFDVKRSPGSFVRYVSAMGLNLPLTIGLIGVAHDLVGLSVAISTAVASSILLVWNYIAVKWAVARQPKRKTR